MAQTITLTLYNCRAWAVFTLGAWAWRPSTLLADLQCGHTPFSSTHAVIRPRHRCPSICSSPCTWKYKRRHRVPVCTGSLLVLNQSMICIPINPCNANVWKWRLTKYPHSGHKKKGGARRQACLPRACPFSLSPTTSKRLLRRLEPAWKSNQATRARPFFKSRDQPSIHSPFLLGDKV